jgi:hypothetical protein
MSQSSCLQLSAPMTFFFLAVLELNSGLCACYAGALPLAPHSNPPASNSQVLGLQARTTMPNFSLHLSSDGFSGLHLQLTSLWRVCRPFNMDFPREPSVFPQSSSFSCPLNMWTGHYHSPDNPLQEVSHLPIYLPLISSVPPASSH